MLDSPHFDIAIVGAGIAGLTCAQQLHQAGYRVAVIEKSRGLGGRVATRRLQGTHADHGVCYLKPKDGLFKALLDQLIEQNILRTWTEAIHQLDANGQIQVPSERSPRYACAQGMTAIAKFLATDLTVFLNHRVEALEFTDQTWRLQCENAVIAAKALIIAIPSPQAVALLEPITSIVGEGYVDQLKSVNFSPCISAIAVYPAELQSAVNEFKFQAIVCPQHSAIGWIGIDSTKQLNPTQPVIVVQSNAAFAIEHLEATNLQDLGEMLLSASAQIVAPWLATPETLQVHRWRYAFAIAPLAQKFLSAESAPLICTGDWCGGDRVESAFLSGLATAREINRRLQSRALPTEFWRAIA